MRLSEFLKGKARLTREVLDAAAGTISQLGRQAKKLEPPRPPGGSRGIRSRWPKGRIRAEMYTTQTTGNILEDIARRHDLRRSGRGELNRLGGMVSNNRRHLGNLEAFPRFPGAEHARLTGEAGMTSLMDRIRAAGRRVDNRGGRRGINSPFANLKDMMGD